MTKRKILAVIIPEHCRPALTKYDDKKKKNINNTFYTCSQIKRERRIIKFLCYFITQETDRFYFACGMLIVRCRFA